MCSRVYELHVYSECGREGRYCAVQIIIKYSSCPRVSVRSAAERNEYSLNGFRSGCTAAACLPSCSSNDGSRILCVLVHHILVFDSPNALPFRHIRVPQHCLRLPTVWYITYDITSGRNGRQRTRNEKNIHHCQTTNNPTSVTKCYCESNEARLSYNHVHVVAGSDGRDGGICWWDFEHILCWSVCDRSLLRSDSYAV